MSVFDYFLSSFAADVVGVYTQDFKQVFSDGRPIKAIIKESSKVMEHPVETGASITDFTIILPVEIELSLLLNKDTYRDTYKVIKQLYLDRTLLIVQTKTDIYSNQLISDLPHEEDPEMYDAIAIGLKLREVQFAETQSTIAPRNPTNTSTVDRGNQQTTEAPASSAAYIGLFGK